jgi:hypothetical protein
MENRKVGFCLLDDGGKVVLELDEKAIRCVGTWISQDNFGVDQQYQLFHKGSALSWVCMAIIMAVGLITKMPVVEFW